MRGRRWVAAAAALIAALAPLAGAFAKEIVDVTISGPGLQGQVRLQDPSQFEALVDLLGAGVTASLLPDLSDQFYEIRIAFGDEAGEIHATTVYRYYPDPAGGQGFVLYAAVEGGHSDSIGQWHRASASGDRALRSVLASLGVALSAGPTPQAAASTSAQASSPAQAAPSWAGLALSAAIAALAGVAAFRRTRGQGMSRG